jgi:hypothetical protein
MMAALLLPGFLLMGLGLHRTRGIGSIYIILPASLLVVAMLGMTGCGSGSASKMSPQPTTQTFSVTADAGSVTHTSTLTITVQ